MEKTHQRAQAADETKGVRGAAIHTEQYTFYAGCFLEFHYNHAILGSSKFSKCCFCKEIVINSLL